MFAKSVERAVSVLEDLLHQTALAPEEDVSHVMMALKVTAHLAFHLLPHIPIGQFLELVEHDHAPLVLQRTNRLHGLE